MKTKIFTIIAFLVAVVGLSSCGENWEPALTKTGEVSLKSMGVNVLTGETETHSRAEIDLNPYLVKIYDEQNALVEQWTYGTMPELFSLPVGHYRVDVASHEVQKAEWDKPYYLGSKEFDIENSKITEIGTVTCKFSNLRVSIKFSDDLAAAMGSDVEVTVVANDEGELVFKGDETRSGYFAVVEGSNTLAATFKGTVNGHMENLHRVYTSIEAGQHIIITFSLKTNPNEPDAETGQIDPTTGITIEHSVIDENKNGSVNPGEDNEKEPDNGRPDEEFPDNPNPNPNPDPNPDPNPGTEDAITFESSLTFGTPMEAVAGTDGKIIIKAPAGIKNLIVTINSTNDDFAETVAVLSGVDLTNPGDTAGPVFQSFGIVTGDQVLNQTEVPFDITQFIPLLGGFPGTHTFGIDVTDNDGNNAKRDIIFTVQ